MDPGPAVFMSYRRADTGWAANAIATALRERLPSGQHFLDNSSIPLGAVFAEAIEGAVRDCDVFIVLIGPRWDKPPFLERLQDPQDWVRREIQLAHSLDKHIVPVLIDRTDALAARVPDELRFLDERQRFEIRQAHPEDDIESFVDRLASRSPAARSRPTVGVEATRATLDRFLRGHLPSPNQWSGNRNRLVDLALTVLGPTDRLAFLAPCRINDGPPGSAAVLITGRSMIIVEVGEDLLIRGEIRLSLNTILRVEVVPTLPLFADVVLHTGPGGITRLQGMFRDQVRQFADHLRGNSTASRR